MSALRIVRVEGDARARGRRVGELLGDVVERSLGFYRDYLGRGGDELEALLAPYRRAAERTLPDLVAWLDGLAEGAGVPPAEVFAVNALEELEQVPAERCSTFAAAGPGFALLGHNEMWLAGDAGNVAVVVELPLDGPAIASPTLGCCLPAVGTNAHRVAQGIDSLTARDDGVGVPRVLVSRHSLDARNREDALRRAALACRAGGYAHVFATAREAFAVETTARRAATLKGAPALVHTNHYLDAELHELGHEPSASSASRYEHLRKLVEERPPRTPRDAMELLRDRACEPSDDGDCVVVFSMVCDVGAGRMWVAPGHPGSAPFEEVDLAGVV